MARILGCDWKSITFGCGGGGVCVEGKGGGDKANIGRTCLFLQPRIYFFPTRNPSLWFQLLTAYSLHYSEPQSTVGSTLSNQLNNCALVIKDNDLYIADRLYRFLSFGGKTEVAKAMLNQNLGNVFRSFRNR